MAITAETRSDIIELVVAAYDAAPGTELLTELVAIVDGGGTLADVAANLTTRTEWTSKYPSFQTATEFATEWLGTLVPEASAESLAEGIAVAEGLINGGSSFGAILLTAQSFLSGLAESDASFGTSAALFNNKAEVATYHTVTLEESAQGASTLSGVTSSDATVTTAKAAADTAAQPAADAGVSYTLGTGLDSKTLGSGNDSAFATDSTTAASDTFNVSDLVDGGAGTDTFFLTIDSIGSDLTYTPSRITNFEKLSLTNVDDAETITVDANLMGTGVNAVEISASTMPVNITNITSGATIDLMGNTAAVDVQHKNAGFTGTSDSVTVNLVGNTGAVTIDTDGAQDIELLTINASGTNSGNMIVGDSGGTSTVTSVTVTGTGTADLEGGNALAAAVTTLDASANSGGVTFTSTVTTGTTLTGGSGNDSLQGAATGNDVLSGGAGNDTLTITTGKENISGGAGDDVVVANGADKDDTITGGDGTDTLSINAALSYDDESTPTVNDAANISGFELLRNEAAITQDMAAISGIVGVEGESGVLTATEAGPIADFYALDDSVGLDITLATDGTADNLNIHMGEATSQDNSTGVTVDAIEMETALIHSKGLDGNTLTDFEADSLTALTITGNKTLSVTLNDSSAVSTLPLTTVDASAFTGASLTVSAVEADSGVTVTTGSAALTATVGDGANSVTGTAGDDSITTGSGADTISTSDGEDTISAGDGANTITVGNGNATITGGEGVDTVTAGNGNNTITLNDGADVLTVGTGNNTITNKAGNATITAGDGENTVTNTAGNSTITLGDGGNTVTLTAGNSTLVTGDLADTISVTAGNNNITSGGGNDTITLGSGNDTVDAGAGTDSVSYSVSSGTWAGSISNAETVAPTFTGSASIDFTNVTGYTALTVSASDDTTTVTLKNLDASSITVSDDNAEDAANGDIEALVVDTEDDQAMTITIGANQEASTATAADFTSLTLTDASSLTLGTTGGGFGNLLDHDIESLVLDDNETTSLVVGVSDYTSLETGAITTNESLESLTVEADAAEADIIIDGIADGTNLSSLTLSATGLNASIDINGAIGAEGEATDSILNTFTVTASNGGDVTFSGLADAEIGDINTSEDADSVTMTASGAGSTITAGRIFADGLDMNEVTITASAGATIDMESDAQDIDINYGFDKLSFSATGTGTTMAITPTQDAGSLAAATEATLTFEADDGATINMGAEAEVGGVDLDTVHIGVGANATIDSQEATIVASGDIGTLDIDLDANSNHTEAFDITMGRILTKLSFVAGDEAEIDTNSFLLELSDDVEAEVGVYNLEISIADTDGSEVIIDAEAAGDLINIGTATKMSVLTVGETSGSYYTGSITIAGDDGDTVLLGSTAILDASALDGTGQTTGSAGTFGSWSITTGAGADTITGSPGADTITTVAGADTISGGAGNDTITSGNDADTVTPGLGTDSVVLTESVSAADIVIINTDPETATEGDSEMVTATGEGNNVGEDTITTFTAGVDTIRIVATDVETFVHATDTDLGDGTSSSTDDENSEGFATNVGLINMDGETADQFNDDGDVAINFSSPTTTMTEALFEAALQYNVTGTDTVDTITTGGLADTIKGGLGADVISTGGGADVIILSSGLSVDTVGDFTAETDVFNIDLSDLNTANAAQAATTITIIGFGAAGAAATDIANGTTEAAVTITGATAHAALADKNILLLDAAAGFATVAAAVDSFEDSGDETLTHQSNIAADDAFLFAYENSTTGLVHIALANFAAADDNNGGAAVIADAALEGIDLVKLTGVTDVTDLSTVDFNFVT